MISNNGIARIGPVHFQGLEDELEPVGHYFKGRVLNAGCGDRDIDDVLLNFGGEEIVNYDIASTIPNAILGTLTDTPFEDNEFDSIICNAVLEHVPEIEKVMAELARVLKPGGFAVVGVPYLQPYHPCPTDFRRYTRDGLVELGELHGLSHVALLPVHTIWQTVGWIMWEWALEKGGGRKQLVYPFIWLMTRLNHKTDHKVQKNGNTFQIVYTK